MCVRGCMCVREGVGCVCGGCSYVMVYVCVRMYVFIGVCMGYACVRGMWLFRVAYLWEMYVWCSVCRDVCVCVCVCVCACVYIC